MNHRGYHRGLVPAAILLGCTLVSFALAERNGAPMAALGTVRFATSCTDEADARFDRALALLHHMMYAEAEEAFAAVVAEDPDCAMAHWGIAMSLIHPVWAGSPTPADMARGREALAQARASDSASAREGAYLDAAGAFFDAADADYPTRLQSLRDAMRRVHDVYPDDADAAALYALMLVATAPVDDVSRGQQRRAAELLADVRRRIPDHPGSIHYAIHAHDSPELAAEGEEIARRYDAIAPEVPHALHMASHIFVRLGMWSESAQWNRRSADAALALSAGAPIVNHYPHAMDYLAYAYLQQAADDDASALFDELRAHDAYRFDFGAVHAFTAIPARLALERQRWAEAAALPIRTPEAIDWDAFPQLEAITHFARGIGAARSGNLGAAQASLASLEALGAQTSGYWSQQVKLQRLAVSAWIAHAQGDDDRAVQDMRAAAELEAEVGKHPVTPSGVAPVGEQLGDLYWALNRPAEALAAYEAVLRVAPHRLNSLAGAVRAASALGDVDRVGRHRTPLLEAIEGADGDRARLLRSLGAF
ncbi:MAG: hypothetical protein U5K81_12065 [Trueperaceae bacterium]|nr:hypothetical protein [Trueperaceae bacterium]